MKHTNKYNLNLIEMSDTFSPAPINENTQKLEDLLHAGDAARDAADASLDARVTALEGHKVATGSYVGRGSSPQDITLGFTPTLVFVDGASLFRLSIPSTTSSVVIRPNGFRVDSSFNTNGKTYPYFAIK